jgi:MFS family permease
VRWVADPLKDRWGAQRIVAVGGLVAAVGVGLAAAAVDPPLTIAGFALAGAGIAAVFPFIFSAAGRHGATALAGVATMGYSGVLIGPHAIGFVAHWWGMQAGLLVIAVTCVPIPPFFFALPLRQMWLPLIGPVPVNSQILAINVLKRGQTIMAHSPLSSGICGFLPHPLENLKNLNAVDFPCRPERMPAR